MKLGVLVTCFNEVRAVDNSIANFRAHYPESPIYLVTEGNSDYLYMLDKFGNISINYDKDTMFFHKEVSGENYREFRYQQLIKFGAEEFLKRVVEAIGFCKTDYLLLMDPDTLVRGKLTIPKNAKILGSRINCCFPDGIKKILANVEGAKIIERWGVTPGIFHCDTFMRAYKKLLQLNILEKFVQEHYAIFAHDVILPLIFALIGEEEMFNPDIVECNRNPNWESTGKPLVHQYKVYY